MVESLKIDDDHTVRMVKDDNKRWFCVTDICDCLGTKSKVSKVASDVEISSKKLINIKTSTGEKEALFVLEPEAYNIIFRSRAKNSKEMKKLLFQYIKGEKKIKEKAPPHQPPQAAGPDRLVGDVLTAREMDEFVEIDNKEIESKLRRVPDNPINVPETKDIVPKNNNQLVVPSMFIQSPELAHSYLEKQLELEKFRIGKEAELQSKKEELDAKVKVEKIKAEMARDVSNRKLEFMNQSQTFLKLALKHASFEDRQKLSPLLQEFAKASQTILWENFDMDFKASSGRP